jgi:hypothetical protein
MPNVQSLIDDLNSKASEKTRATLIRHGSAPDRTLGVSIADLKAIAKTIKGQQALALELYDTGYLEAMYLAGIVATGTTMTRKQLDAWAEAAAGMPMISEYTVPWVAIESPSGPSAATAWVGSKKEHIASSGWCTWSGLVATQADHALDLRRIQDLLDKVVAEIHTAKNRARYTMNGFVIAVATYVEPLLPQARAAAHKIGTVSVDMGDTACKISLAPEAIAKNEALGRIGRKRKTIRC